VAAALVAVVVGEDDEVSFSIACPHAHFSSLPAASPHAARPSPPLSTHLHTQGTPTPPPPSFLAPLFADPIKFSQILEDLLVLIRGREGGRGEGKAESREGGGKDTAPATAAAASSEEGGGEKGGGRVEKFAYVVGVEEGNASSSATEGTGRLGQALAQRLNTSFFSLQHHHTSSSSSPSSPSASSLTLPPSIPSSTPASPPSVLLCAAWVGEGNGALVAEAVRVLETRGFR